MDKNRLLSEKIDLLSECLASLDTEAVFVVPAVRALLQKKDTRRIRRKTGLSTKLT